MRTVGVDLGGTNVYAVVLDGDITIGSAKQKTPRNQGRDGVLDAITATARAALRAAGIGSGDVAAVGVGSPGVVSEGTVGAAVNIAGFRERFALDTVLSTRLGRPVRVANDVTAAAVGEHALGSGIGTRNLLTVFVGTGVGGGLVLDGRAYEGSHGGAGEFGHMVVRQGGAVCTCGRRGCVEAYAGRQAMENQARESLATDTPTMLFDIMEARGKQRATSAVFREALARADGVVTQLLDGAVTALAIGITNTVNMLDLDVVILGGGLADKLGDTFLARLDAEMRPHLFFEPPRVRLVAASLGDESGAIGAALLAREPYISGG